MTTITRDQAVAALERAREWLRHFAGQVADAQEVDALIDDAHILRALADAIEHGQEQDSRKVGGNHYWIIPAPRLP